MTTTYDDTPEGRRPGHWYALDRDTDVSGLSGTGRVASLLHVPGKGALQLWDTTFSGRHSMGVEWLPDLAMVEEIHCHNGATRLTSLAEDWGARMHGRELLAAGAYNLTQFLGHMAFWTAL